MPAALGVGGGRVGQREGFADERRHVARIDQGGDLLELVAVGADYEEFVPEVASLAEFGPRRRAERDQPAAVADVGVGRGEG